MRQSVAGVILSVWALMIAGCATVPDEPQPASTAGDLPAHFVAIDSLGRVWRQANSIPAVAGCADVPVAPDASEGVFEELCGRNPWIEQIFVRFAKAYVAKHGKADIEPDKSDSQGTGILFYFNGGLNSVDDIGRQAKLQTAEISKDGYFSVFMAWPTAAFDTYIDQAYHVSNGTHFDNSQVITGTARIATDMAVGVAHSFGDWLYSTRRFGKAYLTMPCEYLVYDRDFTPQDPVGRDAKEHCLEKGRPERQPKDYESPSIRVRAGHESGPAANVIFSDDVDRGQPDWVETAIHAATAPSRTLLIPFVDGFGEQAWNNMKRRTQRTIRAEAELNGTGWVWETLRERYPHGLGGFAQFFALLDACTCATEKGLKCPSGVSDTDKEVLKKAHITLVGHSMGAIVVNQLLQAFPRLNYSDIVFLSGAATINQTLAAMDPLLREGQGRIRFYNIMLHPLNEARETHFGGTVPTGSLLIWIDEMFEHPDTQLDRTVGQWANMRGGRNAFSAEARQWMQLKIFDLADDNADAKAAVRDERGWVIRSHGGYNAESAPFWRRSFWSTEHGSRCEPIVLFPGEPPTPQPRCPAPQPSG